MSLTVVRSGLPRTAPCKAHGSHQPRHRAAGDRNALAGELPPDLAHAIDPEVLLEHPSDLGFQGLIALGTARQLLGISPPGGMGVIRRGGDRQDLADRLDPVDIPMIVDEGDHGFHRRSSSAWVRIPMKPDAYSKVKPDSRSDFIPVSVPKAYNRHGLAPDHENERAVLATTRFPIGSAISKKSTGMFRVSARIAAVAGAPFVTPLIAPGNQLGKPSPRRPTTS